MWNKQSPSESALQTEASALLKGLCVVLDSGLRRIVAESDNLAIINAINGSWSTPWTIRDTIEEIKQKIMQFQYIKIRHCRRQANRAADYLATKCTSNISTSSYNVPRELMSIILQDVLG